MSFTQAIQTCFSKYVDFSGRAGRAEYWWWFLFNVIVGCIIGFISFASETFGTILEVVISLAIFLPSLAVAVRRLHDTGRSGWWILIGFIPLIGAIVLLVFYLQQSQPEDNKWGPVPA